MKLSQWRIISFVLVMLLVKAPTLAQQRQLDSLKTRLALKLPDTTRAYVYYDIANIFYKQNRSDSSIFYLKQMHQVCLHANNQTCLGEYSRLSGVVQMHQGHFEEALTFYQAAIKAFNKDNRPDLVAKIYHNLGLQYKMMGASQGMVAYTQQGLTYMQKAIALNERFKAGQLLRSNYINIGIIYEDLGKYKLGRDYFYKALAPINQTKVTDEDARILYNNLGKNYSVEGQHQQAITYLEKALAINLSQQRFSSLTHNYRNLATAYNGLGQSDKAVQYGEKALEIGRKVNDDALRSSVYNILASVYADAGMYDKAYKAMLQFKRIDDSLVTLAKTRTLSQLQGQYAVQQANALATVKANLELAKTQALMKMEGQKAKQIAAIQSEEKRQVAQIKATADVEKTRAVAELQAKYDTQKKVHQIAELDQRNQQRARQIKYMTGGLGVLLVLLSALVGQYYIIRRTNRRLFVQNEIITANSQQLVSQSDQLRVLMKELHHRVKNNLAIVSSLLNIQLNQLDDEKAIQVMRIGQQRVEAMSLIHQRLYQTDHITTVNMADYLADLADSLMRAFGYQHDAFRLQLNVDMPELDVDVAIPLGLIVNELVTNAFKYAYLGAQHPSLRIDLRQNRTGNRAGLTLEVQDNGPGIEVFDAPGTTGRNSFGKRLITLLSEQLDGRGEWFKENGTLFRLSIQNARLATAN